MLPDGELARSRAERTDSVECSFMAEIPLV